jgi:hypothetical protein
MTAGMSDEIRARLAPVSARPARQPADITAMIAFLASDQTSWVTGQAVSVSGGFGRARDSSRRAAPRAPPADTRRYGTTRLEMKSDFPSTILRQRFERARSLRYGAIAGRRPAKPVLIRIHGRHRGGGCCDPADQRFERCEPKRQGGARARRCSTVFGKGPISVFDVVPYEFQCWRAT